MTRVRCGRSAEALKCGFFGPDADSSACITLFPFRPLAACSAGATLQKSTTLPSLCGYVLLNGQSSLCSTSILLVCMDYTLHPPHPSYYKSAPLCTTFVMSCLDYPRKTLMGKNEWRSEMSFGQAKLIQKSNLLRISYDRATRFITCALDRTRNTLTQCPLSFLSYLHCMVHSNSRSQRILQNYFASYSRYALHIIAHHILVPGCDCRSKAME